MTSNIGLIKHFGRREQVYVFGDNLLVRLKEQTEQPDLVGTGRRVFLTLDENGTVYTIKKNSGWFAPKICKVLDDACRNENAPDVIVYDPKLRGIISGIVDDLNKEGNVNYQTRYALRGKFTN